MAMPVGVLTSKPDYVRKREALLALAQSPYSVVGIQRVSADRYVMFRQITANEYVMKTLTRMQNDPTQVLATSTTQIGGVFYSVDDTFAGDNTDVDNTDATQVVRTGTWSASNSHVAAYGGTYRYSTVAGSYVEFTPSVTCVGFGLHALKNNNGGIAKATIDGDTTKCNMLPTAQDLVDAGVITALQRTSAGLATSDRCVSFVKSSLANVDVPVAVGLTPGTHTLRLTNTGIQPAGSSSNRLYDDGYYFSHATPGSQMYHVGTGWSPDQLQDAAYGGSYRYTTTVGDKCIISAVGSVVSVGWRGPSFSNGGIHRVSVDGSFTAANLLPTGQDMVNAGLMSSTYLTTLGGPIAPTDRVINMGRTNNGVYDLTIPIASGLTPGVHNIEIICTTARQVGASSNRLYSSGMFYSESGTALGDPGVEVVPTRNFLYPDTTIMEFAYDISPNNDGSNHMFTGNQHGQDWAQTFEIVLDGTVRTPADGDVLVGSHLVVHRTSYLRHADTGATNLASVDLSYDWSIDGLWIEHTVTWLQSVKGFLEYPAMMAASEDILDRGAILTVPYPPTHYSMNPANGGDNFMGQLKSDTMYQWSSTDDEFQVMWNAVQPEATNYWQGTDRYCEVQDRVGNSLNKLYMHRDGAPTGIFTINAGEVWHSKTLYRHALVPGINALVP